MKERELDYKKSMDQLLKDKDDANRQLKMMQEGKKFGIIHPSYRVIICMPRNKKCQHLGETWISFFYSRILSVP